MIRSKAALIEALANTGARLHTGATFRTYVTIPGQESQTVHAGAFKALQASLVQAENGETYRLHWIDTPVIDLAPGREDAVTVSLMLDADTADMLEKVSPDALAYALEHYDIEALVAPLPEHQIGIWKQAADLIEPLPSPFVSAEQTDAMFKEAAARLCVPVRMLMPPTEHNGMQYGQPGHVCHVTGRRAMTLEQAAKYQLKEGERMHMHSKLPGKTWRRVAVIVCANNACRMQWFGGGWRDIDRNRVVYIGE